MKKIPIFFICVLFTLSALCQTLDKGSVVGIHTGSVKLSPDVTYNQWKNFCVNEYLPAFNKVFEGEMKAYFMEGERGKFMGSYGFIIIIKSEAIRDKYWPEFKKSSEMFWQKYESYKSIYDKLNELGKLEYESTDWIVQ
jgi:hypothetical protein